MIRLTDVTKLAYTKLRTRRIRHGVVIAISSVLFIAISTILFLARGTFDSVESYMSKGLSSKYLIGANLTVSDVNVTNPEIISRAKEIQKEFIKQKIAEAKRLGIDYDQKTEQQIIVEAQTGGLGAEYISDLSYPPAYQALQEYYKKKNFNGEELLNKQAESYGLNSIYKIQQLFNLQAPNYLQILENGKESYSSLNQFNPTEFNPLSDFSFTYTFMSGELLKSFLLPEQNFEIGSDGSIPILIPYIAAQKLLGIKDLDKKADINEKAEYLTNIRNKSAGLNFDVCYRNTASESLLNKAVSESQDYNTNKDKKDYVKPDLVTGLPSESCGAVTVLRDVRTSAQKNIDSKQLAFDQKFSLEAPEQARLKYRVVGLLPSNDSSSFSLQQLLQFILTSTLGSVWVSPIEVASKQPTLSKLIDKSVYTYPPGYVLDFKDVVGAKKFVAEKTCDPDNTLYDSVSNSATAPDPFAECKSGAKYYTLSPFGGNSLALAELKTGFYKFFRLLIIGLAILASIILLGVVSRVIADTRRETAVFRAIGAKRLDIVQIYITYVLMLGTIISISTLTGSFLICQFIQNRYSPELSLASSIAFNTPITNQNDFRVYGIAPFDVGLVVLVVLISCLLSAILPTLTNVRRNPINDMRDER